ncbi:neuronal acetylcholine receptor subunit beta-3-like [Mya arenaria]|uniref:neuronal acetylcholine receptor subunit beta-3-like n=1 Tax=Mya arenaria TaxID=6604 RepID=UPI0022E38E7B|nr:neuronal acetylcholine receptor subunit beta-3-like [Mya arenaria]
MQLCWESDQDLFYFFTRVDSDGGDSCCSMDLRAVALAPGCLVTLTSLCLALASHKEHIAPELAGWERRLYANLTSNYNAFSRPVMSASQRVHLNFSLSLNQVIDLDEKHQILTTYVWINERWDDANLRWRPEDFDGIERLMFPAALIWLPDIFIFNIAGFANEGFVNVSGSRVLVLSTGKVTWSIPLRIRSACPVDATYFPYDRQSCDIHFGSWIYDFSQIDISLESNIADVTNYVVNNEFDLYHAYLRRTIEGPSCCPGNESHPMVHLSIQLKRKTNYYDYIVIAPTLNLCVLTLATFLLPCECGWKIAIGLTVFLTLYVLQLLIAENVPDTNSTPLISVFILLVMSLNSISLITATIIMNIKRRSLADPPPPVPRILMHVCEKYLARVVCARMTNWKRIASTPNEVVEQIMIFPPADDVSDSGETCGQYVQRQEMMSDVSNESADLQNSQDIEIQPPPSLDRTETAESSFSTSSANDNSLNDVACTDCLLKPGPCDTASHENYSFQGDESDTCTVTSSRDERRGLAETSLYTRPRRFSKHRPSYKKAIKSGHTVTSKRHSTKPKIRYNESQLSNISRKYQWYFVADVIDTTAFLIYVIVMFLSIVTVLVIIPLFA